MLQMNAHNGSNGSACAPRASAAFQPRALARTNYGSTQVTPRPFGEGPHVNDNMAIVGISLGNPNQEGAKFEAILDWASKNFDKFVVIIFDTLYRHNYLLQHGGNMAKAFEMARHTGKMWHLDHQPSLDAHKDKIVQVHTWETFRTDPNFTDRMDQLIRLEATSPVFRDYLDQNIAQYFSRGNRDGLPEEEKAQIAARARLFILEELAGYSIIADKYKAARIYPSEVMPTFQYFKLEKDDKTPGFESLRRMPHVTLKLRGNGKKDAPPRPDAFGG